MRKLYFIFIISMGLSESMTATALDIAFSDQRGFEAFFSNKDNEMPLDWAKKIGGDIIKDKKWYPPFENYVCYHYLNLRYWFPVTRGHNRYSMQVRLIQLIQSISDLKQAFEKYELQVYPCYIPQDDFIETAKIALPYPGMSEGNATGCLVDEVKYQKVPAVLSFSQGVYDRLPDHVSLKKYCPTPGNQGLQGTCVAWATAYSARTILWAILYGLRTRSIIDVNTFSANFVYEMIKSEPSNACAAGAYIGDALNVMKIKGVPYRTCLAEECGVFISPDILWEASFFRINGYNRLESKNISKIDLIRKSIKDSRPVVISFMAYNSFSSTKLVWNGVTQGKYGWHALTVIGYDDELFGGAVEVINSWGTESWGKKGFAWIRYDDLVKNCAEYYQIY